MAKISFEEKMAQLDQLIAQMQLPETGLEEAIALYEKAAILAASCQEILRQAQLKIEEIGEGALALDPE